MCVRRRWPPPKPSARSKTPRCACCRCWPPPCGSAHLHPFFAGRVGSPSPAGETLPGQDGRAVAPGRPGGAGARQVRPHEVPGRLWCGPLTSAVQAAQPGGMAGRLPHEAQGQGHGRQAGRLTASPRPVQDGAPDTGCAFGLLVVHSRRTRDSRRGGTRSDQVSCCLEVPPSALPSAFPFLSLQSSTRARRRCPPPSLPPAPSGGRGFPMLSAPPSPAQVGQTPQVTGSVALGDRATGHQTSFVMSTVCSACAQRLPSVVMAVHPSSSSTCPCWPSCRMGSIVKALPGTIRRSSSLKKCST
jgi:hypothetical protein